MSLLLLVTLSLSTNERPAADANTLGRTGQQMVAGEAILAGTVPEPLPLFKTPPDTSQPTVQSLFPRKGRHPVVPLPAPSDSSTRPVGSARALPRQRLRLPIFMYHYIRVNPNPADTLGFNLSVTPGDFAAQLDYLVEHGYHTVGLQEVAGYLTGELDEPPPHSVVLSFDDGYRDFFESAYPLLKARGFRATVFMISGLVGRPGYLTVPQLRELADNGITIGAHTVGHPDLPRVSRAAATREIAESKAALEKLLDRPVLDFAFPSGRYNAEVADIVKTAGYRAAVTVVHGLTHGPEDRFTLSRVRISGGQRVATIAANAGLTQNPSPPRPSYPIAAPSPLGGPSAN